MIIKIEFYDYNQNFIIKDGIKLYSTQNIQFWYLRKKCNLEINGGIKKIIEIKELEVLEIDRLFDDTNVNFYLENILTCF